MRTMVGRASLLTVVLCLLRHMADAFKTPLPPGAEYRVVFIRHGESEWNRANRFIGWEDIPITELGILEARSAATILKREGYRFDVVYTSYLKRAIKSAWAIMAAMDTHYAPVEPRWQLNEQMYGMLTGLNKFDTIQKYGYEQVQKWRRSYEEAPPAMKDRVGYFPPNDRKYLSLGDADVPDSWCGSPGTESLKDTQARAWSLWKKEIFPDVKAGKNVLVCGHGNVIRAFFKRVDRIPNENMKSIDFPRAMPLVYYLDANGQPVRGSNPFSEWVSGEFLGNGDDLERAYEREKEQLIRRFDARTGTVFAGDPSQLMPSRAHIPSVLPSSMSSRVQG